MKRRPAFLAAILREGLDVNNVEKYRICLRHFVYGKPAKALDKTNIDWAPTLYLGHTKRQQRLQGDQLGRSERARRRTEN